MWNWRTPATSSSTATHTVDDGRSLPGAAESATQTQRALNKRRDSGRSSGEQMKERLHSIAQDMYEQELEEARSGLQKRHLPATTLT